MKSFTPICTLLRESRAAIKTDWLATVQDDWISRYPGLMTERETDQQAETMLSGLHDLFRAHTGPASPVVAVPSPLADLVQHFSNARAKAGLRPVDTTAWVMALKSVLGHRLVESLHGDPAALAQCLRALGDVLDRLSLLTIETFVETREKVITEQSLSLLELATPVILLWNHILLLPLVGVIDTLRARQFTERLLAAISQHEANVTIIDVTGVPVFDTSVARHIMKAVDAAQLLGSRIVMTGISPESAQALTKLGVSFTNVTSRATLRAGVAEALQLTGKRIVSSGGSPA